MSKIQININKNSIEALDLYFGRCLGQKSLINLNKAWCEISLVKDLPKDHRIFNPSFSISIKFKANKAEKPFKETFSYSFDMIKVIDEISDVEKPLKASIEFSNIRDKHILLIENE